MSEFDPSRSAGRQDDNPGHQHVEQEQGHGGYPNQYSAQSGQPGLGGGPAQPGTTGPAGDAAQDPSAHHTPLNPQGAPGTGEPTAFGGYAGYMGSGSQGRFGGPEQGYQQQGYGPWGAPTGSWNQQQYPPYGAPGYGTPGYGQPEPPRKGHSGRTIGISVGVVALSVLAGFGVGRFAWSSGTQSADQAFGSTSTPSGPSSTSINASAIASKVDPALVDINTVLGYQSAEAAGTGIVLTKNGEILTNNHVVEGATSIKVTDIGNGKTYSASVVGYDRTKDIAVLQLANASGLTTATLGDSAKVTKGDAVVGIGNAGGAGGTPSAAAGTVTALNQSITASDESSNASEQLTGLIETNANIQSGDSGGSLVNSAGQVIGVDTAASSDYQFNGGDGQGGLGQGSEGQGGFGQGGEGSDGTGGGSDGTGSAHEGYAIPIDQAITIAHQIIGKQASSTVHIGATAFLGVQVSDPGQAQQQGGFGQGGEGQGSQGTQSGQSGAEIVGLVNNGAAQQAGLAAGDVVTSVDGKTVGSATDLTNLMDSFHPGDKLSVVYTDSSGQQHTVTVTPASGPIG